MADLFSTAPRQPLAEALRPATLNEVIGQTHLLGVGKPLRLAFEAGKALVTANKAMIAHHGLKLAEIRAAGLFKAERLITSPQSAEITLGDGRTVLNFCANNYLGLSSHPELLKAAHTAVDDFVTVRRVLIRAEVPRMRASAHAGRDIDDS